MVDATTRAYLRAKACKAAYGHMHVTGDVMVALLDALDAAERERDALAALLREARDELQWCCNALNLMPDDVGELMNRIDAALDGAKE
jgi:hypothetical protein